MRTVRFQLVSLIFVSASAMSAGPWVQVSARGSLTCAVGIYNADGFSNSGRLACAGKLADGATSIFSRAIPQVIGAADDWQSVSAGSRHFCALKNDSTLWCSGFNSRGQLGDGSTHSRTVTEPGQVYQVSRVCKPVTCPACGKFQLVCKLQRTFRRPCIDCSEVRAGDVWKSVSAGGRHTCAVDKSGTAWCWGANDLNQLGNRTHQDSPVPVQPARLPKVSSISAGENHSCAVDINGSLWCWGSNKYGQTGRGIVSTESAPVMLKIDGWQEVSAGQNHTCAIKTDNTMWCWGSNKYGQLGDGTTAVRTGPIPIAVLHLWVAVAAGGRHTCALDSNNAAWCWGSNKYGQLGDCSLPDQHLPAMTGTPDRFAEITAGLNHSAAALITTALFPPPASPADAWGANLDGQLGDGSTADKLCPIEVSSPKP